MIVVRGFWFRHRPIPLGWQYRQQQRWQHPEPDPPLLLLPHRHRHQLSPHRHRHTTAIDSTSPLVPQNQGQISARGTVGRRCAATATRRDDEEEGQDRTARRIRKSGSPRAWIGWWTYLHLMYCFIVDSIMQASHFGLCEQSGAAASVSVLVVALSLYWPTTLAS